MPAHGNQRRPVRFEVGVYNKAVRDALAEGDRHRDLPDTWAEVHWQEVRAVDADEARAKTEVRFPPHRGFVITEVFVAAD